MEDRRITPVEPIYKDKAFIGQDDLIKKDEGQNNNYAEYQRQANEEIRKKMEENSKASEDQGKPASYKEIYEREQRYKKNLKIERDDR